MLNVPAFQLVLKAGKIATITFLTISCCVTAELNDSCSVFREHVEFSGQRDLFLFIIPGVINRIALTSTG